MSRKKVFSGLLVLMIVAVALTACAAPAAPVANAKKKIGFSVYDMQYGFFQDMEKGTKEAAEAAGYDYVLVDQKSSEATMVSATQDLINQGIDALIISPVKPDAMGPLVDAAKKKGIPVVVDDIGGGGTAYDVIVISNNAEGGVMGADYLDKMIQTIGNTSKKVASITCDPTAVYAWQRNVNFEKRIKELGTGQPSEPCSACSMPCARTTRPTGSPRSGTGSIRAARTTKSPAGCLKVTPAMTPGTWTAASNSRTTP